MGLIESELGLIGFDWVCYFTNISIHIYIQAELEQQIFQCREVRTSQATKIVLAPAAADLPPNIKTTLSRTVHSKLSESAAGGGSDKAQQCTHLEAFPPKAHWVALHDPTKWSKHLPNMGRLFERMGLSRASEPTFAAALAVIIMARMEATSRQSTSPAIAYKLLNDLKKMART